MTVVDTINRSVVTTIALDNAPVSIVVTPNGQKVYVTDDTTNQITVIATATKHHVGADRFRRKSVSVVAGDKSRR